MFFGNILLRRRATKLPATFHSVSSSNEWKNNLKENIKGYIKNINYAR